MPSVPDYLPSHWSCSEGDRREALAGIWPRPRIELRRTSGPQGRWPQEGGSRQLQFDFVVSHPSGKW